MRGITAILHDLVTARLPEAIDASGLLQTGLARRMDCSRPMLTPCLNGSRCPGLDVVEKFAAAIEIDPILLLRPTEICVPAA